MEHTPFPKVARLNRGMMVTEKVDGTNGLIEFAPDGELLVGSRKRAVYPEGSVRDSQRPDKYLKGTDNFGFARWVEDNQDGLFDYLGAGKHYGEWAGRGIQRGYNLPGKRFFLFNAARHHKPSLIEGEDCIPMSLYDAGLDVVPILFTGAFCTITVHRLLHMLEDSGSRIDHNTPSEGVMVWHEAARIYLKATVVNDAGHKGNG